MRTIYQEELRNLTYEQVKAVTAGGEVLTAVFEKPAGSRILRFLDNESRYIASDRSFASRLRYLIAGIASRPDPSFVALWNRAIIDGYRVEEVHEEENLVTVRFSCPV